MNSLSPQRRRVVLLAALVTILSAGAPMLTRSHPRLGMFYVGFLAVMVVFTIIQFGKAMKDSSR